MAMLTLADFVDARLIEWQAVASAATAGEWQAARTNPERPPGVFESEWMVAQVQSYDDVPDYLRERDPGSIDADANAVHIAYHSPARSLREVVAMRKIVREYRMESLAAHQVGSTVWREGALAARDSVLMALAGIWSTHPDYEGALQTGLAQRDAAQVAARKSRGPGWSARGAGSNESV